MIKELKNLSKQVLSHSPALNYLNLKYKISQCDHKNEFDSPHLNQFYRDGYLPVPDIFTPAECTELMSWMDGVFDKYKGTGKIVEYGYDTRAFIYKTFPRPKVLEKFTEHPFIWSVINSFWEPNKTSDLLMLNKVIKSGENRGSGAGWHRDLFTRNLKVMVYLTDTNEENGALSLIKDSHKHEFMMADTKKYKLQTINVSYRDASYDNAVERMIQDDPSRKIVLAGRAGSAFIFDTSCLHRGLPVRSGTRYAITNYLSDSEDPRHTERRAAAGRLLT